MADPEKRIGHARCPLCSNKRAVLGVNKKGLAYLTCNACNSQVFARSDRSDEALRALHVPEAKPTPADPPAPPAPQPKPAPLAPEPAPAPPQPAKGFAWGMLRN